MNMPKAKEIIKHPITNIVARGIIHGGPIGYFSRNVLNQFGERAMEQTLAISVLTANEKSRKIADPAKREKIATNAMGRIAAAGIAYDVQNLTDADLYAATKKIQILTGQDGNTTNQRPV